jgi:hypothetical protein
MNELSDKNRPKKLEDIFREGMEEAEMAPSDLLWSRIERDLNIKETGYYKKRLGWYQRLAAACVALVLCAGAYLFFDARQETQGALTAMQQRRPGLNLPGKTAAVTPPANSPTRKASQETMNQATARENQVGATLSQPQVAVSRRVTTTSLPVASRKLAPQENLPAAVDKATGMLKAAHLSAVALSLPDNKPGGAAVETTPANEVPQQVFAGDKELMGAEPSLARSSQTGGSPDGLAPITAWSNLASLAAIRDSVPGNSHTLAAVPSQPDPGRADKGKPASRWKFGGKYASQYFDQNIALAYKQTGATPNTVVPSAMLPLASAGAATYADALNEFDHETGSGFSFNTGISAAYQVNKHMDLETGLGYTQNVATTSTSYIFNNAQIGSRYTAQANWSADASKNSSAATGIPTTAFVATLAGGATLNQTAVTKTQAFDTQYRYRLLGIPVKVSYQTSRNKSFYFASMGMLTNLLVKANILSDSDRVPDLQYGANAKDSPFRHWHFAAVASAGKGFEIAPGLQVKAGLEATQYLSNLTHHPDYLAGKQRKPYTLGLALSSSYTFKK